MRKLAILSLVTLMLAFTSCVSVRYQIGQTSQEFFAMNKHHLGQFRMIKESQEWSVYRTNTDEPYYFYFHYGKLYQVDRGARASDIVIEHRY
ncbi:hypothetical protein MUY27_13930 [Mucilaginibacter sp. RS28]|uniref:Uncharacterized protein n=1 Tax=Mucilaginibacter straminoryzae TaxID=2932774 RepID=A0A9X2BCD6_9SPHI|nr:hypothetical protein [Mucilaginibacter straminoryzae]MCJ8210812.1 hypothetical protein [Mucilaginibacter straminoryzae]